nr:exodeoxyribonuclease VII large subunit [Aliamphritea spongicola]
MGHRLEQLSLQYQARQQLRLQAIAGRLNGVSPLATLERGYAITERPDGKVIQQVKAVNPGRNPHPFTGWTDSKSGDRGHTGPALIRPAIAFNRGVC